VENTESTQRQYALRERAIALGWPIERVQVIDCDQGQSGARAADREGVQRLVAEVSLGHAGIVLGLEVSRLARNNSDWHRLLEIAALIGTLILDEDGLYDPSQFNDRLLLGLKGAISEAELHVLRARLRGGILNKARRGALKNPLPVGLVYDAQGREELQQRLDDADQLRRQQVERARYDADLAKDRFMQVDPKNRLVADALEADWNERLRALTAAQKQYERQRQADRAAVDQESRSRILALTTDFPKLWNDPKTPDRERKQMVRLLIEDVRARGRKPATQAARCQATGSKSIPDSFPREDKRGAR
jgi:DNA invertase Pin-like site-specific DNA recombinase